MMPIQSIATVAVTTCAMVTVANGYSDYAGDYAGYYDYESPQQQAPGGGDGIVAVTSGANAECLSACAVGDCSSRRARGAYDYDDDDFSFNIPSIVVTQAIDYDDGSDTIENLFDNLLGSDDSRAEVEAACAACTAACASGSMAKASAVVFATLAALAAFV
jgi:hypothetical protein